MKNVKLTPDSWYVDICVDNTAAIIATKTEINSISITSAHSFEDCYWIIEGEDHIKQLCIPENLWSALRISCAAN